ncbi:hypothetical protein C8R43DRAFT_1124100 [Mycena crocata]|nr:hypothetical protein C8R43DRAFT_1124100 [Mycena crocata]
MLKNVYIQLYIAAESSGQRRRLVVFISPFVHKIVLDHGDTGFVRHPWTRSTLPTLLQRLPHLTTLQLTSVDTSYAKNLPLAFGAITRLEFHLTEHARAPFAAILYMICSLPPPPGGSAPHVHNHRQLARARLSLHQAFHAPSSILPPSGQRSTENNTKKVWRHEPMCPGGFETLLSISTGMRSF